MVKFVNLFLLLDHVSQLFRTKHVKLKLICRSAHETENTGFLLTKSKRAICKTFFFMFREFQVGNAASGFAYQHMGRHFLCSFPLDSRY